MIDIYRIKSGFSNCWLIRETGLILVDSGPKGKEKKVVKRLGKLGIKPEEINLIVLTHGHARHAGGANFFRDEFGTKIAIHPNDRRLAVKKAKGKGFLGKLLSLASIMKKAKYANISPDVELFEGNRLDEYGVCATILCLPGHARESIGVLLDDKSFVAGDMLMNLIFPSKSRRAYDFTLLNKSFIRLRMLGISRVYPGHGKPFRFNRISK